MCWQKEFSHTVTSRNMKEENVTEELDDLDKETSHRMIKLLPSFSS